MKTIHSLILIIMQLINGGGYLKKDMQTMQLLAAASRPYISTIE